MEGLGPDVLKEPKQATLNYLIGSFGRIKSELLVQVLLDSSGSYIGDRTFSSGGRTYALGSYRELFDGVWEAKASAFALIHNHPSGNANPSQSDLVMTRRVAALCKALDIQLLDHLIVANRSVLSMRRVQMFKPNQRDPA